MRTARATSVAGVRYRSGFEAEVARGLAAERIPFEYETRALFYTVPYIYRPDWIFEKHDGTDLFVETKGHFTPDDRRKLLAVKEQHPGIDLRLLFQRAGTKIRKGSKTTYGAWATQNGFEWAEGTRMPRAWMKEVKRA
jgi:hypothetical protein